MNQKQVYVILGMARSGTSVICRALKTIGIDLGTNFALEEECRWNPKGSWEDRDIVFKVNEKVLQALKFTWDGIKFIAKAEQTSELLLPIQETAGMLLAKRFANTNHWGFKDPRTVRILYFWEAVFNANNILPHYVIALRNPLSSAQSYQKLTGTDLEHGLLLWLIHLIPAINYTQKNNRIVVSYDLMMQDPRKQLDRIRKTFHIENLANQQEIDNFVESFLDKNLYHFENTLETLKSNSATAIAPLCIKVYELLLTVAKDEISFEDPYFMTTWQAINEELDRFIPIYSYVDVLLLRNFAINKYVKKLHKSRLWKLISPLRKIDETLRARREKIKQKENEANA